MYTVCILLYFLCVRYRLRQHKGFNAHGQPYQYPRFTHRYSANDHDIALKCLACKRRWSASTCLIAICFREFAPYSLPSPQPTGRKARSWAHNALVKSFVRTLWSVKTWPLSASTLVIIVLVWTVAQSLGKISSKYSLFSLLIHACCCKLNHSHAR